MQPPIPSTRRQRAASQAQARWVSLWTQLGILRAQLQERDRVVREIDAGFKREILPREHRHTDAVLGLSEALIERYRRETHPPSDASLLGLWISENLERLADHPFADLDRVRRLRRRWRAALAPDADSTSSALDGTRVELARLLDDREPDGSPAVRAPDPEQAPHVRTDDKRGGEPGRIEDSDVHAMLLGTADSPRSADAVQQLVDRLFRRLAQALHPDREPDDDRRKLKQVLMSRALDARTARDLDTLLALHVEHIGEALPGVDPATLETALERQVEGMRRALTRLHRGADPLQRHIVERYNAPDEAARARLLQRHATLLEQECARTQATLQALESADGLQRVLAARRARELDRLAIDELTGLSG